MTVHPCRDLPSPRALGGCGGGAPGRQRAGRDLHVDVSEASFPPQAALAKPATDAHRVKNTGTERVPDVAVTVDSFNRRSEQEGLADPERPVWIVDKGPQGGATALVNTWALRGLAPGQTRTFEWKVTPIEAGRYSLKYTVAAGLDGKAKARTEGGAPVAGTFRVRVSQRPSSSRVDPETGEVQRTEE
jgi:hypothetical protein